MATGWQGESLGVVIHRTPNTSIPPAQIQKWLTDIREQEAAQTIAEMLGNSQNILNIGPSWGRDYYHLSQLGKTVINIDIAPQTHLPLISVGDVSQGLPFADIHFDAVLIPEVLEHLIYDAAALAEARRVLKDDGIMVITVPFFNDKPIYHVRVHSPKSIRRLLHGTGFTVVRYIERGGLIAWPRLIHGLRRMFAPMISPKQFNRLVIRFDHFLARRFPWLLRRSRHYGCYIACRKATPVDFREINVKEFQFRSST
jgi:SAM-dependent methyltransferase